MPDSLRMDFGRASASALRVRLDFVRARFGEAGAELYRSSGSAALKLFFAGHEPPDTWVDLRLFAEANVLLDSLFGTGNLALVRAAGHYAALHNAGVWRTLFEKGVDPAKFVEIIGGIWHRHFDGGNLIRSVAGERKVQLEIRGMPWPHRT